LDDKGRLALPTAYRELIAKACSNRLVFTYNPFESECLLLYPYPEWERVRDTINALPGVGVRKGPTDLQRKLVGSAALIEPDGNWRVLVPASQRSQTGIDRRAILLGMNNKFELWSEQAHLNKIRQTIGEHELSDEMLDLKL
jgi:MraZ protein